MFDRRCIIRIDNQIKIDRVALITMQADSTEMIYVSDQSPMQQLPYVTKNFEFGGYLRSGFGVNGQAVRFLEGL